MYFGSFIHLYHLMILSLYHYRDYPPWPGQPPSSNDRDNLHSLVLPRVRPQTHRRAGQEGNFVSSFLQK